MGWTIVGETAKRTAVDWGGLWKRFKERFTAPKAPAQVHGPGPGNHRKDLCRPILQSLLAKGYDTVEWDSGASVHDVCVALHGQRWDLSQFLSGLVHDAPLFERSHPGDKNCSLVIYSRGTPNLPPMRVDSFGLQGGVSI